MSILIMVLIHENMITRENLRLIEHNTKMSSSVISFGAAGNNFPGLSINIGFLYITSRG